MRVSFKWLKDYVEIEQSPEIIAEKLTAAGIAVEGIEYLNQGIEKVVIAEVKEAKKHPDAEKLSLCKLTVTGKDEYSVVCGAPNVRSGQKVPLAMIGAKLPGGVEIKKAKLRGEISEGMICSAKELGLDEDYLLPQEKEGILVLPSDAPLGKDILEYLLLDDCILDLDLTPNRGDCLSVINIAREIAAILDEKIKLPEIKLKEAEPLTEKEVEISLENPDLCPRYIARVVDSLKISDSPYWLRHRLRCSDIRTINNIVDITNYVLLEMGQPLHAFDYDYLEGQEIIVRNARAEETITTLDGKQRILSEDMLLITDRVKAVAVAGVMGGENSEVNTETEKVLIEAAYFSPYSVRKTSTALGLKSDAAQRFEKGINPETVDLAADRAAELMQKLAGGRVYCGRIDAYPVKIEKSTIKLDLHLVNKVLGTAISEEQSRNILERLGFEIEGDDNQIVVTVPPYRPDVRIAEDLIEEVARIYGYDNIPTTLPFGATASGGMTFEQKTRLQISTMLAGIGLAETINYSFINKNNLDKLLIPTEDPRRKAVCVLNPLSEDQEMMRTTIIPGLLEVLRSNINKKNDNLGIFEIGKTYFSAENEADSLPNEKWNLGIALRGKTVSDWKNKAEEIDFYYLKGIVEELLAFLKINNYAFQTTKEATAFHPGRTAELIINGISTGFLGELHPMVAENYDLAGRTYVAVLELEKIILFSREQVTYKQVPRYPASNRDLAFVLPIDVQAAELVKLIECEAGENLKSAEIFDVYQGEQIPNGKKSIAIALSYQSGERTLNESEINESFEKIKKAAEERLGAELRS